jgi:hypothetical protein
MTRYLPSYPTKFCEPTAPACNDCPEFGVQLLTAIDRELPEALPTTGDHAKCFQVLTRMSANEITIRDTLKRPFTTLCFPVGGLSRLVERLGLYTVVQKSVRSRAISAYGEE